MGKDERGPWEISLREYSRISASGRAMSERPGFRGEDKIPAKKATSVDRVSADLETYDEIWDLYERQSELLEESRETVTRLRESYDMLVEKATESITRLRRERDQLREALESELRSAWRHGYSRGKKGVAGPDYDVKEAVTRILDATTPEEAPE